MLLNILSVGNKLSEWESAGISYYLKQLPKTSNANIKNALFVGSTAELQKMLNRKKEDETIKSKNITPEKTDISD